jgi:hypothetical protein
MGTRPVTQTGGGVCEGGGEEVMLEMIEIGGIYLDISDIS